MWFLTQRFLALVLFIILFPVILIICFLIKTETEGPCIFRQKRAGKHKKDFIMYKFRTMVEEAEKMKKKYEHLNEADGPVFKIWRDPRHTKVGRLFTRTGLDELPQLINIMKGEMVFVGPRPLPIDEAKKVSKKYQKRFSVLPGITSTWVVKGSHSLSFKKWMELDLKYINGKNILTDLQVGFLTVKIMLRGLVSKMFLK